MTHVLLGVLLLGQTPATPPGTPCTDVTQLVGTWRVVEVDGAARPADTPAHKHVTPTHFTVLHWTLTDDHHVQRAHGGPISVANGTYTEDVTYGFGTAYDSVPAAKRVFAWQCSVDGDRWHILGTILGNARRETWVRVSPSR